MISVANATGRFGWSSASDYLGRKNTFATFFGLGMPMCCMLSRCWAVGTHCGCTDCTGGLILCCGPLVGCVSVFPSSYCTRGHDTPGIPLYLSIPLAANMAGTAGAGATPLVLFCGSTMVIFTMYGGGFATFPAYIADLFGTKYGYIGVFFFFFLCRCTVWL